MSTYLKSLYTALLLTFLLPLHLWGSLESLSSYEAAFTQTIIDQDNTKIVYSGTFWAKKPGLALWEYRSPIAKSVYINNKQVTIVEPELEQAIYKEAPESFTLFNIIKGAKKVDTQTYIKTINERPYKLKVDGDKILSLHYKDNFDNSVTIIFSAQKPDKKLDTKQFRPVISEDYDIIHQ